MDGPHHATWPGAQDIGRLPTDHQQKHCAHIGARHPDGSLCPTDRPLDGKHFGVEAGHPAQVLRRVVSCAQPGRSVGLAGHQPGQSGNAARPGKHRTSGADQGRSGNAHRRHGRPCEERICLVMDINTSTMMNKLSMVKVKIHKNYSYDEDKLLSSPDYIKIKDIFKSKNSHDLIEELMILFNKECTKRIKRFKNGIYKHITSSGIVPLPEPIYSYINISRSKRSCYTKYLEECDYAQFTSPIRRLVDILNIIQICFNENMIYFFKGDEFYEDWLEKIDYMNISMRHIRKIQLKCKLLDTFIHQEHKFFNGYVFDKLMRSDNKFKYNVYLPELKMNTSITIQEDLEEYSEHNFKIYIFQNEGKLKKKIKLQIINIV